MHVLLVYSHPRADSFCSALRDAAASALRSTGHTVEVRDLYAEGFVPPMGPDERSRYYSDFPDLRGIEDHIAALQRADALLLVYPTWWFGLPAMLKGWFDRVWVPGVAFRLREHRAATDEYTANRGRNYLWLAALAAVVYRLARPTRRP
jgi:NAD(P)H dehydrogenase (quinone)